MPKLLILSPAPTHPTNAGNRARIRKWLETCLEAGVDFHFVFFRHEPGDEMAMAQAWGKDRCTFLDYHTPGRSYTFPQRIWRRMNRAVNRPCFLPYRIDDWKCESLLRDVRQVAERIKPTCVQVEYVFFSHLFACFAAPVFKILDTHDVVAGRERMFLKQGREPEWFYATSKEEAIGVNRADYIVAIQEEETAYFKGLTRKPVATVGHMVELKAPRPPSTTRPTAIFIGSGNRINQDALAFLLGEVWPLVRASVPQACLEVYGGVCKGATTAFPEVRLAGEASDLSQVYEGAWLVMSPLRFGTGLKIKSIEALGRGKALVSTTAGCTGITHGQGKAFLRGDSAGDYANHCINVLTDPQLRRTLEQGAYEFATVWNLTQRKALLQVLTSAGLR